jgi:uncharacterized membrane protein
MPFCANCGSPVEGRFCAKCGAAADVGLPPPPPPPPPVPGAAGMTDNVASAACYVLGAVTGVILLLLEPYNRNRTVRFHAFQSIFLTVAWIVFWSLVRVLFRFLGFFGFFSLSSVISLAFFVLWVYLILSAYQGKRVVLPFIGPMAEQQVR